MPSTKKSQEGFDVIVIGSGVAGLMAAVKIAAFARVCILTKGELCSTNTWLAQGGIAAALENDDSPQQHAKDTRAAGAGVCRMEAVNILTEEGPARINDLLTMGMPFDRKEGKLDLGREGAHSKRRIVHAGGDSTGRLLSETLLHQLHSLKNITVREHSFVTRLITQDNCVHGLELLGGERVPARAIILATGGCSAVYARTTNHPASTGDGIAMAYRAGAEITDMEFVQFHPTVFHNEESMEPFLISEAVRGEGAVLRDVHGRRFMSSYSDMGELGPRDIVSRAIARQMDITGAGFVYLDITHRGDAFIKQRFPTIYRMTLKHGYDMSRDWLPVSPAAHYTMGGLKTGLSGETNIQGLYACGEVSCSGVHGANRLASNSLLEGLVFAERTARHIENNLQTSFIKRTWVQPGDWLDEHVTLTGKEKKGLSRNLGALMLNKAGITRSKESLEEAKRDIRHHAPPGTWIPRTRSGWELKNTFLVAGLIVDSALMRTESRGCHFRSDYPQPDPSWLCSIVQTRDRACEKNTVLRHGKAPAAHR